MSDSISRRSFGVLAAGLTAGVVSEAATGDDKPTPAEPKKASAAAAGPVEAPFTRDYAAPKFKPSWKKPQINRTLVADFVIFAHMDLGEVKKLVEKHPQVVNATMDWGGGDWESGLGGASHMGRRDIVDFLLASGARVDIFCAAMLGKLEVVRSLLTMQPKLIDAKGPHGFTLHFHAQVGGPESQPVLDYLQSVKKIDLPPNRFLKMKEAEKKPKGK